MSETHESSRQETPTTEAGPVRETGGWYRLPYLILFIIVFELVELVVFVTTLVQFILRVTLGRPNERLSQLGAGLGRYTREVIAFLTFATDVIPYPFGSWPEQPGAGTGSA